MTPAVEERFRTHVAGVVARAAVPAAERDDLAEELLGHLADRWGDHLANGLDADAAADRAIADFGSPGEIGREFQTTYHSRVWASTIGVLLPVASNPDRLPGVVLWAARGASFLAVLSLLMAASGLILFSPVRAVLIAVSMGLGAVVLWLAAEAFRRGQAWGRSALVWAFTVESVVLFTSLNVPAGLNLSINGIVGFLLLLRVLANGRILDAWVATSARLPSRLAIGVAATMLAWAAAPFAVPGLADPTQAAAGDIDVVASVACAQSPDGGPLPAVTVALDITWRKIDVLPFGIARAGNDWGDSVKLDFADPVWTTIGPHLVDLESGQALDQNGAWGLTVPAVFGPTGAGFVPDHGPDAGVDASVMRPGRTVRLTLDAFVNSEESADLPTDVEIHYAHRDQFILMTDLACGGRGRLRPEEERRVVGGWDLLTGEPLPS